MYYRYILYHIHIENTHKKKQRFVAFLLFRISTFQVKSNDLTN